ncbi:fibrobacter succinogenes major paralogous domain-containing protein [Weeksellaceae bacterium KMM 9724]|uniref:FISUMP domain-containing protein n=1 Tax=Profundicola chukchiensis TaxID=2961959 RepID=UPI002437E2AF|nr:FISUMP domain-containing protein [Profundicola chukchiensis]MDG4949635.1 fibrobacter succinogenes major paralogous domain-containing protein [Profundicola chukchiensis]
MKLLNFKVGLVLALTFVLNTTLFAQSPEKLSYQAVVRNAENNLVANTQVGMQISILQGSESGAVVYSEVLTPTTNANGLVSVAIGEAADLSSIDWSNGTYFIKTETDPNGGTDYSIVGTSQLLSVPYALHAKSADGFTPGTTPGEMKYWNGSEWADVTPGNEGDVLTFVNNTPTWVGEGSGEVIPTVTNPTTGKIWMDKNLGAEQVATSSFDEASYGDLYQWGRGTDGHEKRTSASTTSLSDTDTPGHGDFIINGNSPFDWRVPQNHNLWDGAAGINNPCPTGFRLPTENEWNLEMMTWSSMNVAGAFDSVLKLPAAGQRRYSDGDFYGVGVSGSYWASTLSNEAGGIYSRFMNFRYSAYVISAHRATANSVRCIKHY